MHPDDRRSIEFTPDNTRFGTECRNCGTRVTGDFARVFGDNQDRVFHCHNCTGGRHRSPRP